MDDRKKLKTCKICGNAFWGKTTMCYCSDECREIGDRINKMKSNEARKARAKEKGTRKKRMPDLARVNEEARAAGMSYGKYVAHLKTEEEREDRLKAEEKAGKLAALQIGGSCGE